MMCIISKEWIAFCAQVEGTPGEVFEVSPTALQPRCQHVPDEPIPMYGHCWPSTPECSFKIGHRQSEKKRWNCDGRAICNATRGIDAGRGVCHHRGVSAGSDGARPLWQSHPARTEIFFADVLKIHKVLFCYCAISIRHYIFWVPVLFPKHFMIPCCYCQRLVFQHWYWKCHFGKLVDFSTFWILVLHSGRSVILSIELCIHGSIGYSSLCSYPYIVCCRAFVHWLLLLLFQL